VVLERVIKLQPSFASAHYRLMSIYPKTADAAKRDLAKDASAGSRLPKPECS